jgi:hypothetical protein
MFIIRDDWRTKHYYSIPFNELKEQFKNKIGQKTDDGDLILEVRDCFSDEQFEVVIQVLSEKTKREIGGEQIPLSFSIQMKS